MLFHTTQRLTWTGTPEELEATLDPLMRELLATAAEYPEVIDPDLGASVTQGWVDVTMDIEAPSVAGAVSRAFTAIQGAIIVTRATDWQAATAVVTARPAED